MNHSLVQLKDSKTKALQCGADSTASSSVRPHTPIEVNKTAAAGISFCLSTGQGE